ncbi:MAG: hypothetical protein AAGJ37_05300 [Pseudomonadota bacterium]
MLFFFLLLGCSTFSIADSGEECVIVHPGPFNKDDTRHTFPVMLLALLLESTEQEFGRCDHQPFGYIPQKRQAEMLSNDAEIDIAWLPVSNDYNDRLRPIPVPIRKGLLGWRLLMTHSSNKEAHKAHINAVNIAQRRVIEIPNPYLSSNVPVDDPDLWFKLNPRTIEMIDN